MTTALSIINRAAELIGYKDPDETLSGNDSANFLGALNSMVDAWALDSLFVYAVTNLTQAVSGNPVTIGEGATLNTVRPVRVLSGGFFRVGGVDFAFDMIGRDEYEAIRNKSVLGQPMQCYYDAAAPTASLYFWPALGSSQELHLPTEQRLSGFADLATDYTLLPGYQLALEYSLAEELAPGRRPLDQQIFRRAVNARRAIRTVNARVPQLDTELLPCVMQSGLRPL